MQADVHARIGKTACSIIRTVEPDDLLTIADAAKHLGVDPATVWREINRKRLRAKKLGREYVIIRRDLTAYEKTDRLKPGPKGPRKPPAAPPGPGAA